MKRIALALAALPLLLAIGAVPSSAAATNARVRLVYLSPDDQIGNVDFYIDGRKALANTVYDTESVYVGIAAGQHTFDVRKAGSPASSTPVAEAQQSLDAGSYWSVFAGGKVGSSTCPAKAVLFNDAVSSPPSGQVSARFVHMAPEVPGVDVVLNNSAGTRLFTDVSCFQSSAYANFPTGSYPVALVATGTTSPQLFQATADLTRPGAIYTLVGAGGVDQPVSLVKVLDAASAGSTPQGAAATGEGGTAFGGMLPLALIAGSMVACALLLAFARRLPARD